MTAAQLADKFAEAIDTNMMDGTARRTLHTLVDELRALGGGELLSESDKDVALAQAVEFAEYVERQAKGEMVKSARKFLSLPYAQEIAKRLIPPGSGRGGAES